MLLLFFYLSYLILVCKSICIVNCPFCPLGTYNENFISESNEELNCLPKIENQKDLKKKILIIPENYAYDISSEYFSLSYSSLSFALLNETYEMSKLFTPDEIYFYFLNYDYAFIEYKNYSSVYFRKIEIKIEILPLSCSELDIFGCFSQQTDFQVTIYLQSFNFFFFISQEIKIKNLIFYANISNHEKNNLAQNNGEKIAFFNIDPIDDKKTPILIMENVKLINFNSIYTGNNIEVNYFIQNNNFGSIDLKKFILENCSFFSGFFYYKGSLKSNASHLILIDIYLNGYKTNEILNNDDNASIHSIFSISGFCGSFFAQNLTFSNIIGDSNLCSYFFIISNCIGSIFRLFDIKGLNAVFFGIFEISNCAVEVSNLIINSTAFCPLSLLIGNENTVITIKSFKIFQSSLKDENSYFIKNSGNLIIENFFFIDISNITMISEYAFASIKNGCIESLSANRLFIFYSCTVKFENIFINCANAKNSLFLFYSLKILEMNNLFLKNISYALNLIEIKNTELFSLKNSIFDIMNITYFVSPMPIMDSFSLENISLTNLICCKIFQILKVIPIIFKNFFIKNVPIATGNYIIQLGCDLNFENLVFEEIYGKGREPASMFSFRYHPIKIKNSAFINIGWRNNDTSFLYSIDDNAVLFFYMQKYVYLESCVFFSKNVSFLSGFVFFEGESDNQLIICNSFFKTTYNEYLYSMAIISTRADFLNFTNNKFIDFECPTLLELRFSLLLYTNGPVGIFGEPTTIKKSNDRIAILQKNIFLNCNCKNGGSFSVINYEQVFISDCYFNNSASTVSGGIFTLISIGTAVFNKIIGNFAQSTNGAIAFFNKAEAIIFSNSYFTNIYGKKTGAFEARNTRFLYFNQTLVENLRCLGIGAFLIQNGFIILISYLNIVNSSQNEALIYIYNNAEAISISNSIIYYSSAITNAGFLVIDSGKNASLYEISLLSVGSESNGGALIVKTVDSFYVENIFISNSTTNSLGIFNLEGSNEFSKFYLNNITCIKNRAEGGSCIFFDSASFLSVKNLNIENCEGSALVFFAPIVTNIILNKVSVVNNTFNTKLIKIEDVNANISFLELKDNMPCNDFLEGIEIISLVSNTFSIFSNLKISMKERFNNKDITIFGCQHVNINISQVILQIKTPVIFSILKILQFSKISLLDCTIEDLISQENKGLLFIDSSDLKIISCTFKNNLAPIIYALNSNLTMYKCHLLSFENLTHIDRTPIEISQDISILNLYLAIAYTKIEGHPKIMISADCPNILLLFSFFTNNNESFFESKSLKLINVRNININSSQFRGFDSFSKGGAISLINSCGFELNFIMYNSSFSNNFAYLGGAVYIFSEGTILLYNSTFLYNKAFSSNNGDYGSGGSLYFEACRLNSNKIDLFSNIFGYNKAEKRLPDLYSSQCFNSTNNLFLYNDTNVLRYLALPLYVLVIEKNISIKPGKPFNITFKLVDCHNQILDFDESSIGNLNAKPLNFAHTFLIKSSPAKSSSGLFVFKDTKFMTDPKSNISLIFTFTIKNSVIETKEILQQSILSSTTFCSEGEILQADHSCYQCPNETYSSNSYPVNMNDVCLRCPDNANCWNGSNIIPQYGYWKSSRNSTIMFRCIVEGACVNDDLNENSSTKCATNHYGNLCNLCNFTYGKFNSFEICKQCDALIGTQILRLLLILFLTLIYVLYSSKNIMKEQNKFLLDQVLKIIINHFQRINSFIFSEISFQEFKYLQMYFIKILTIDVYSDDCFLQIILPTNQTENLYLYKSIISLFLPFIISFICTCSEFFILHLRNTCQKTKKKISMNFFLKRWFIYVLICSFLFYSFTLTVSFSFFNCFTLSNDPLWADLRFLEEDPNFKCFELYHIIGVAFSFLIGIIFWGILYPLFLWNKIGTHLIQKTNVKNVKTIFFKQKSSFQTQKMEKCVNKKKNSEMNFQFFYKDYKKDFYYWECIVFMQKLILNIIFEIGKWTSIEYSRFLNTLFLLLFIYYITKLQPFHLKIINKLEYCSLIASILTNIALLGLSSGKSNALLVWIFYIMEGLSNFCFFVFALVIVLKYSQWKLLFARIKTKHDHLKSKLKKYLCCLKK